MARMAAPYTCVVYEVAPEKVAARLASGFRLIEGEQPAQPAPAHAATAKPAQSQADEAPAELPPAPTRESTIAEIRAYAKAAGIDLPKGSKAKLLAALGVG